MSEAERTRLWEEYQHLCSLFTFYLDLVSRTFSMAMGIAGAVAAFVISKGEDGHFANAHLAGIALTLPALLCLGVGSAFLWGLPSARGLHAAIEVLRDKLALSMAPHVRNLATMLTLFGIILAASGFVLGAFAACRFFGIA